MAIHHSDVSLVRSREGRRHFVPRKQKSLPLQQQTQIHKPILRSWSGIAPLNPLRSKVLSAVLLPVLGKAARLGGLGGVWAGVRVAEGKSLQ